LKPSSLTYAREDLNEGLISQLMPLISVSKDEMELWKNDELDVDWNSYFACQQVGIFRIYTCRDTESRRLVGYMTYHIQRHPHCSRVLCAFQDALYLAKDFRKGMAGIKLIKFSEQRLKSEGVQMVFQRSQPERDISKVLQRIGYTMTETVFTKRL